MSRDGSSRCRSTTNFWWCDPPVRTRMSRRHWPPASSISMPSSRDFSEWKPSLFQCERQSSPRTSTPRRAAAANVAETVEPGSSVSRWSGSPRQSTK